jgi:hypothetical protein
MSTQSWLMASTIGAVGLGNKLCSVDMFTNNTLDMTF